MKLFKKAKKGFTLIELVVVIAVIAILSAVSIVSYVAITNKAKQSNDQQKINQVNLSLAAAEVNGKPKTMYDAIKAVDEDGFGPERFKTESKDYTFAYKMSKNRFVILEKDKVVYPKDIQTGEKADLWVFSDKGGDLSDGYSHYLRGEITEAVTVNAGIDVGENENVPLIQYVHSGEEQTVVIRTKGGKLGVEAPNDHVKHFGSAQMVTLTSVSENSFYENGEAEQINIKKGRLVLTNSKEASVGTVYLQATGSTYDNIIIATQNGAELPELIARDNVPLPSGSDTKKVVTIQSNVNAEGKNPEKTETINLYSTVGTVGNDVYEATSGYNVSDLAKLVVEASSDDAKAQAQEQLSEEEYAAATETKAAIEVTNYDELKNALDAKAKYILVKADFSTSKTIFVTSDVTIDGENHSIVTSADRGLRIQSNNVNLSIRNLTLDSNNQCQRGIQVDSDFTGHNISLDNVKIVNNTYYAINMCGGTAGTFIATNCEISGWSALNTWGSGHKITFNSCSLKGTNNKSVGQSNNYAVLCLEADSTYKTSDYSSFNTVSLNNCVVTAVETNSNRENIVNFNGGNPGSTGNTLITTNCTFNSANKHAFYDGGSGNSWINNGEEMLPTIYVDLSGATILEDGCTATGSVKFVVNGKTISMNFDDASTTSAWSQGIDYIFDCDDGRFVYNLDLDLSLVYETTGYGLYTLHCSFSK